jgi:hypothetical protein
MEASFCGANQGDLKDIHFNNDHFAAAGRNLLKALIIYSNIDCHEIILGKKQLIQEQNFLSFDKIKSEFEESKEEFVTDESDDSIGSDSEPSDDNMSDSEISKILPVKLRKKRNSKLTAQNSFKKRQKDIEKRMKERLLIKREEMEKKILSKSPVKRIYNNRNIFKDKLAMPKIAKVEKIDAWTQTSNPDLDGNLFEDNVMPPLKIEQSTMLNFEPEKGESPTIRIRRNSKSSKFKVRIGSSASNQRSFRSPVAHSNAKDYIRRKK